MVNYARGSFCSYMSRFAVSKGMEHTHTSIIKPSGSFYISPEDWSDFMEKYKVAMAHGEDLHMTEKHREIGPILIDLDFRFSKESGDASRKYNQGHIEKIIKTYDSAIREYLQVEGEYTVYIMEKPTPVIDKKYIKDGLHVVIPDLITKPVIQLMIRQKVLKDLKEILSDMDIVNNIEDIVDEAVIERNNWQMYGSKKPNGEPYKVTRIIEVSPEGELKSTPFPKKHVDLVERLSIRNKYDESPIKIEKQEDVKLFIEKRKKSKVDMSKAMFKANHNKNVCDNIDWVCKLVEILDSKRAEDYESWIRTGWCLRNIDHRLMDKWIEFSKRSDKYTEGECERFWNMMRDDGLGIGTLCMWARQDNFQAYQSIVEQDLTALIKASESETHYDIAKVVHFMFRYDYVCISIKNNMWYEFKNHRWVNCDGGYSLRQKISVDIYRKYMEATMKLSQLAATELDSDNQKVINERIKKINGIAMKLKQSPFKDNIIKECRELFYIDKFEEKLDSRTHLIGFENGVYDLEAMEFREGRPEDFVCMSTKIDYVPYEPENEAHEGIYKFVSTIFPKEHMRDYVLKLMGSFLNGGVREEKFHIWTGVGCHEKDTAIMMADGTSKKVQDIQVGDKLMGDDSEPRTVLQLFRGQADMFKIIPIKGDSFNVTGNHVLSLKATNMISKRYRNDRNCWAVSWKEYDMINVIINRAKCFPTEKEADDFLEKIASVSSTVKKGDVIDITVDKYLEICKRIGKRNLYLYKVPVSFPSKEVSIDPWIMGYWLGNGNTKEPKITTMFPEVVDYIKLVLDDTQVIKESEKKGKATSWRINHKDDNPNYMLNNLRAYGVLGNKHIPNDYKYNSRGVREALLAGILDSDGHYQEHTNQFEITLELENLIDDVAWIARSLGFACYKNEKIGTWVHNGVKKSNIYYRLQIVGDGIENLPTIVSHKVARGRVKNKNVLVTGFKIEKSTSNDNYYGFELDGNHRYLLDNFTVTHNSNGKSVLIDLFERAFGEYCCKFPVTLLTMKRPAANAPTAEIARSKGRRFAVLQEPSEDEKMNVGLMKEMTGGDKIMARQMYKEPIEFKPQFKMVLTCNHLPNVPSDDGGTWRRIRVVEFTSRFCENPNPENPNEFPMDKDLCKKFDDWKEHFMALLIEYYRKYVAEGIKEPDEVMKCTRDYQRSNDIMMDFIEQEIEKVPGDDRMQISLGDLFTRFQQWIKDNAPQMKNSITKKTLKAALEKSIGKIHKCNGVEVFKECKLKSINDVDDELDI